MRPNIIIAGSGGIGQAAGLILAEKEAFDCHIYFGDRYLETANQAVNFVNEGCQRTGDAEAFLLPESGLSDDLKAVLEKGNIILDCLPGSQAPRLAQYAKDYNLHYANLTEYVNETNQVTEIAKEANTGFVLQTGLAPGFINVLAMKLLEDFCEEFQVNKVKKIKMKVGALSEHALAPHFYAFTWSPIGVSTEYIKDAIVVRDYEKTYTPSLSETKGIIIDGDHYEENFTSGGAADLPDALAGRVKELDYKTLRYPGHYAWVKNIISNAPDDQEKIQYLEDMMLSNIPSVEDDVVVIYATVIGKDSKGRLRSKEKSYKIYPKFVGTKKLRAIQTTTAAPLCEAARMLLSDQFSGPIFQSQIVTKEFLNGPFVSSVYGKFDH